MKLLLSPHNDDEGLFASFIALREKPKVIVCLDGSTGRKYMVEPEVRAAESQAAMDVLGCEFEHLGFPNAISDWGAVAERLAWEKDVERVWVPMPEPGGHRHHNALAETALALWGADQVSFYSTYHCEPSGWPIRTTHGHRLLVEDGWPKVKRAALDCYVSQIEGPGTRMHFERDLDEYEASTLRLNLGGGLNPIPGYVNLDKSNGWLFEDGLGCYPDATVEAITVSHVLMYVSLDDWPYAFSEMARVLRPAGMIRITEDAIGAPGSGRPFRRPGAALETTAELVLHHLAQAGLDAHLVDERETAFADGSLVQRNYGHIPDVFHVEAVAPVRELVSR